MDVPPLEDVPSVLTALQNKPKKDVKKQVGENKPFGGFKTGFLFGKPTKPQRTSTSSKSSAKCPENIPHIKAKSVKSGLVIPEVQKAMSNDCDATVFQQDLSNRIESNPDISNVLSDPHWLMILDEFQSDTEAAMKKYENNKTVKDTMLKLCGTFGDSFLHMAPTNVSEEEKLVKDLMESPQIRAALMDPFIVKLMDHQKAGRNDTTHRMMMEANPVQKAHIQALINHGLFTFVS